MFECVIFDMDGLMFDTEVYYRIALNRFFEENGLKADQRLFDQTIGMNIQDTSNHFRQVPGYTEVAHNTLERVDAIMRELYAARGVPLKPGLLELLEHLKVGGYPIGLATSTDESLASFVLETAGVAKYFDKMTFGNMVENGKPAPDIYILAAKRLGMQPDVCLVLEDSCAGIRSATDAGMHAVMVPDAVQPDDETLARAEAVCETLLDVIPMLGDDKKYA